MKAEEVGFGHSRGYFFCSSELKNISLPRPPLAPWPSASFAGTRFESHFSVKYKASTLSEPRLMFYAEEVGFNFLMENSAEVPRTSVRIPLT